MNFIPFLVMVGAVVMVTHVYNVESKSNSPSDSNWESYKTFHRKWYQNSTHESHHRRVFNRNKRLIAAHNLLHSRGLVSYKKELNRFTDEDEGTLGKRRGYKAGEVKPITKEFLTTNGKQGSLPTSFDWRNQSAVSPVKDQGQCGCCWAFSATGALESQAYLKTHQMRLFSEQQLVDCDEYDGGCGGGNPLNAWYYIYANGGIQSESSYPFTSGQTETNGVCAANQAQNIQTLSNYAVLAQNETTIQQALISNGPLSMAMDASNLSYYSEGIYTCPQQYTLDHAVLIVGYGVDSKGNKYWIVKNQWGTNWGLSGYFYLQRGTNACGMASQVAYPII